MYIGRAHPSIKNISPIAPPKDKLIKALMPAMAVTSLLAPGPKAAAAAAGRPQTRGGSDQTTPGSERRSTSAGGSRSSGGARDAGGARARCCLADFFLPRPAPLQIAALGGFPPRSASGACGRQPPDSPQGWRKLGLKRLSGIPQRPTFCEEEGGQWPLTFGRCDGFGGECCDLQSAPISPPSLVTKEK